MRARRFGGKLLGSTAVPFYWPMKVTLTKALKQYKRASKHHCQPQLVLEVEEFICWVLQQEPDKVQLHFCLGLVNHLGKRDYARSLQDFEKFLEVAPLNQFRDEIRLAEAYIGDARGQLSAISPD